MKRQSLYNKQSIKRNSDYPDVLTVEEASEILNVYTKTVYKMIKKSNLKKQNVGRLFRIPKSYIVAYLGIENKKIATPISWCEFGMSCCSLLRKSSIIVYVNGRWKNR